MLRQVAGLVGRCAINGLRPGGTAAAMLGGICELTLEARDIAALEGFYTEAFGLRVLARTDDRVWLAVGPATRLGLRTPGPKEFSDRGGRHVHFALSAEAAVLDRLPERLTRPGAARGGPVQHSRGDRSLYVEDPEGNVVEVWDFFVNGRRQRSGVAALADESGGHPDDPARQTRPVDARAA